MKTLYEVAYGPSDQGYQSLLTCLLLVLDADLSKHHRISGHMLASVATRREFARSMFEVVLLEGCC